MYVLFQTKTGPNTASYGVVSIHVDHVFCCELGKLDAGEEVAHAGLDGRDTPVAVELGGDDRDGLVGVGVAHLLPLDLGDAGELRHTGGICPDEAIPRDDSQLTNVKHG